MMILAIVVGTLVLLYCTIGMLVCEFDPDEGVDTLLTIMSSFLVMPAVACTIVTILVFLRWAWLQVVEFVG